MRAFRALTVIATALICLPRPLAAQEGGVEWVGRRVVTLYGTVLREGDRVIDDQGLSSSQALSGKSHQSFRIYRVEVTDGLWLKLSAERENARGWVMAEEVIPIERGIAYYTARIRDDPTDPASYSRRGLIYVDQGALGLAVADFNESIRLDPAREVYYLNRGVAYRTGKDYTRALADFDKAIKLDPAYARAYLNRGIAWAEKKEYDKAIADFGQTIKYNPKSSWAYNNRGNVWIDKKEYAKAMADEDEAIKLDPNNSAAYINRGSIYRIRNEYERALSDYSRAVKVDPTNPLSHHARAWLLATCPEAKVRDGKAAVAEALRANALDKGKDPHDLGTLAAAYAELGNFRRAVEFQGRAQKLYRDSDDYRKGLERLTLYKAKKPYREQPSAESKPNS
jgi:tetratricopeptide (TPR) repeat protein